MRLLLDQGLPRSTRLHLSEAGVEADHVGDLGLAAADDAAILRHAREQGQVVVTLDADFHAQLALSGALAPSVIRVRIEGLRAEELAALLVRETAFPGSRFFAEILEFVIRHRAPAPRRVGRRRDWCSAGLQAGIFCSGGL